jgi:hypothetical protein
MISRVTIVHGPGERQAGQADSGGNPGTPDRSDPKALARSMHEAGQGKDFGAEFKEVATRLETGEKPGSIENSLRKRTGQSSQTH